MAQQIMNAQNSIVPAPRIRSVTLACRRLVAWSLEVGLVAMSAAVPWGLGQYVLSTQTVTLTPMEKTAEEVTRAIPTARLNTPLNTPVPVNPLVQQAQQEWARITQLPPHRLHRTVPRLTNILWTAALIAPIAVAGGQFIQLNYTGCTWPKRWLGLRVFSMAGESLQLHQALSRELMRWGLPVVIVGGLTLATEFSLGVWAPAAVGLLAMVEGVSAIAPDKRAWHDRIANTYVTSVAKVPMGYLPIHKGYKDGIVPSRNGALWSQEDSTAVQLYGETDHDDEWWLTEAEGNLTSMVLVPRASLIHQPRGPLVLRSPASSRWSWWLITSGMVLACAAGFGIGRVTRSPGPQTGDDIFLETAQKLANQSLSGDDYSAAILMLAQTDDPRAAHYLTDLLSQSSQPEALATIQQALISQGLDSLPFLLALSRVLESDLQQSLDDDTRHIRLEQRHVVQDAIAKLLIIHNGNLDGTRLDRVNLGRYHDADRAFQLIQPGLLAAGTSWQGANLNQANLAGASFFDVGADGKPDTYDDIISNLSQSQLIAVSLERANLQGAQLDHVDLRRANLSDANLVYGNLENAQLTNAQLIHVNAAQSHWQGSNLVGADLTQAIFNGADLSHARLNRIDASHSQWIKAILPQSDWIGANLMGADFRQTQLTHANFQGANLDSTNFTGADLRQANLRDTDLRRATLTGVNLTDADLSGAIFDDGRTVHDSFITPNAQLNATNHLRGVNFSRVRNLDGRQLNYICAQGGVHPTCPKELTPKD
ncbi:pentapeptide repeat-containing protein [Leptolyngbya cf. ectocarpi LEGE 11479]|uniref:Pentapeptide repeat-containing protein n=1 Tax=Leptolyngbya cf. ectocarpi LEGE 11479 TaxID=1828722 RepID=A0A928WYG7_LEPEC|nr:pentapeptide repeat-containing protein [Leptolyngbya ectocarpi]MBE9065775.1 pentapeptide repeat-containing protein [Leptolyngbya cf. ectocarpi LEGE 11479]